MWLDKEMGEEGRTSFSSGKITRYNPGADWESYIEQLDLYFIANGVTDDHTKKAMLLSNVSTETYQLLKDLLVPDTPKDADVTYSVGDSGPVAKAYKARTISIGCSI